MIFFLGGLEKYFVHTIFAVSWKLVERDRGVKKKHSIECNKIYLHHNKTSQLSQITYLPIKLVLEGCWNYPQEGMVPINPQQ